MFAYSAAFARHGRGVAMLIVEQKKGVCMCVCIYICVCVGVGVRLSACLPACLSVCLSVICLPVGMSVCLSVCLFVCLGEFFFTNQGGLRGSGCPYPCTAPAPPVPGKRVRASG